MSKAIASIIYLTILQYDNYTTSFFFGWVHHRSLFAIKHGNKYLSPNAGEFLERYARNFDVSINISHPSIIEGFRLLTRPHAAKDKHFAYNVVILDPEPLT